jgi:hypothetical protein
VTRAPPRSRAVALAPLALAAAVAGCDAQADRDYPGEPLATLDGRVVGGGPALPPLEAAMLWQRGPPPSIGDQELATRVPVESGFPATFTIRLYQPPPPSARRSLLPGEVSFARGNAAALPYGIAAGMVSALPAAENPSYGVDVDHWVVHLEADVPGSSLTAWWLGAALPAGYHLLRVDAVDPACIPDAELELCVGTLVARGVPDDGTQAPGTARGFCLAPYRLSPAPPGELILLTLGTYAPPASGACP